VPAPVPNAVTVLGMIERKSPRGRGDAEEPVLDGVTESFVVRETKTPCHITMRMNSIFRPIEAEATDEDSA
jgi:hypothetical protein